MTGNVMDPKLIKENFGVDGFVNGSKTEGELKKFYEPARRTSVTSVRNTTRMTRDMATNPIIRMRCTCSAFPPRGQSAVTKPVRHHGKVVKGINPWRYVPCGR